MMIPRVEESYPAHSKAIDAFGKSISAEIHYIVFDASDEQTALNAVLGYAPKSLDSSIALDRIEIDERLEENTFSVTATYNTSSSSNENNKEDEEATLSFHCGGGSTHVAVAYEQECIFGNIDPGLAVGWNGETGEKLEIAGVDVPAPDFRETYTKRMNVSKLTTNYRRKVGNLVGKVNKSTFKGWQPGEAMLVNVSFSASEKDSSVMVTFEFSIRPNEDTTLWGEKVFKRGFDYLWTMPQTKMVDKKPALKPKALFRAQIVQYADFSVLGV
jgi:hypothetical protein